MKPYHTSVVEEKGILEQVHSLLDAGLIKENNSPYSFPVTSIAKYDKGLKKKCVDYRKLNAIMKNDAEPLPRIDEILNKMKNTQYFPFLTHSLSTGIYNQQIPKFIF